ncbi:hypothetical protein C6P45_004396 [Maudiozyma exigua]|uniref:V-SNARE coiled-coil homology domain-containing protein n=1 Tax=Maudiozyma exigua TaxID=34358 RepID=A0A9P7B9V6_MAUEX|nr:hypothetical protein C6P45_004396 [Kazachstania exigua]
MKRFNITYLEIFKDGKNVATYYDSILDGNSNDSNYGTSNRNIKPEVFHKIIEDLVLPKVILLDGNKVTKVASVLIDDYDCFYTTSINTNEILVCFTKVDTPKILPLRILSDLKQDEYKKNDSNIELRVHIGEILDKFHEELLTFKKQQQDPSLPNSMGDQTEGDIQDVIQIMSDNIDKFLQRQERVSLLLDKTSKLNNNSSGFKRKAARINDRLWWQRMKNTTLLIFSIILITSALFIFYYVL